MLFLRVLKTNDSSSVLGGAFRATDTLLNEEENSGLCGPFLQSSSSKRLFHEALIDPSVLSMRQFSSNSGSGPARQGRRGRPPAAAAELQICFFRVGKSLVVRDQGIFAAAFGVIGFCSVITSSAVSPSPASTAAEAATAAEQFDGGGGGGGYKWPRN